jgi:acetyl-CoA carboxylase biotin carboxyl carrier protein
VDLTNEDVADILALLDSLPYDSLDLRTDRFRLTLRRSPGGWTEESDLLAQPIDATPEVAGVAGADRTDRTDRTDGTDRADGISEGGRSSSVAGSGGAGEMDRVDDAQAADAGPLGSAADEEGLIAVAAPLPGTFYRAPRPGAPPFVEEGNAVGADTVVAIIETMKLMNSVPAGTPGRVARICLENGEFAPLGATLLLIEPDSRTPIDSGS